ncbi:MAG TPA: FAD-dependent oxidoreductase, partial [Candidatus Acidoferrales bacterium]|nr:FAD-dependent oxidoreductase [Candidatus Acidoferrales bacterium]
AELCDGIARTEAGGSVVIPSAPLWWHCESRDYPALPRVQIRADVAVIGAGLTGLSAAYHILKRRPEAHVVLLEAQHLGAGASGRTTGILGPGVGQSLAALVRRLGTQRARALYVASLGAVRAVKQLVEREKIECELAMTGQLVVARTSAGRGRLSAQARLMRELDLPGVALDDAALDRAIVMQRARGGAGTAGLRLPVAGTLHPMRLLCGLADRVTARGGEIFPGARVISMRGANPVRLEIADGGAVLANRVVLATAGYTPALGVMRGRILPVHLQVIVTEPLQADALEALRWNGRESIVDNGRIFNYFRLTADNRIVFGGGAPRYTWRGREHEMTQATALDRLVTELKRAFAQEVPIAVAGGWTGVIGYSLDALPALARMRGNRSVVHAVGWCGHGIALSVAAGEWLTQMLCDGAGCEDLPWYRDNPPLLPFELLRWTAFRAGVRAMGLMDRYL